jgi:hypothetical protein
MSSLLLALICWNWQAIPVLVWDITSPVLQALVNAIFAVGWLILSRARADAISHRR